MKMVHEDNKLFVGGLAPVTTNDTLRAFAQQWGEVTDAVLLSFLHFFCENQLFSGIKISCTMSTIVCFYQFMRLVLIVKSSNVWKNHEKSGFLLLFFLPATFFAPDLIAKQERFCFIQRDFFCPKSLGTFPPRIIWG